MQNEYRSAFQDRSRADDHGSARWATYADLEAGGWINSKRGMTLGYLRAADAAPYHERVTYDGDQHLITIANNRSGKGTTAIIPALLDYRGAVLCIDPKGENAYVTGEARERLHKQSVQYVDPWNITAAKLGKAPACFNPMDILRPDSPTLSDDCELIADALVIPSGGDDHWSIEAKALLVGFLGHVATSNIEHGQRHLPRVRDILSLPPAAMMEITDDMANSRHDFVRKAAGRLAQKTDREFASVLSTANANTHFLDSPAMRANMEKSSFRFERLKDPAAPLTVFLILPADRLRTHARWLRVMVAMAIKAIIDTKIKPREPALFLLDEFAALGRMAVIEQAFGLMAGYGMQMWAILQDLSQLQDLYKTRWQTFIANAGVVQIFGTRDMATAEYVSKLGGQTTWEILTESTYRKRNDDFLWVKPDPAARSMDDRTFGRQLITPDEVMKLPEGQQLLFLPKQHPAQAEKAEYYKNARYFRATDGRPFFRPHPDFPPPTEWTFYTIASHKRFLAADNSPPLRTPPLQTPPKPRRWTRRVSIALACLIGLWLVGRLVVHECNAPPSSPSLIADLLACR